MCTLYVYVHSVLGSQGNVRLCVRACILCFFHDSTAGGLATCLERSGAKNVIVVGSITLLGERCLLPASVRDGIWQQCTCKKKYIFLMYYKSMLVFHILNLQK